MKESCRGAGPGEPVADTPRVEATGASESKETCKVSATPEASPTSPRRDRDNVGEDISPEESGARVKKRFDALLARDVGAVGAETALEKSSPAPPTLFSSKASTHQPPPTGAGIRVLDAVLQDLKDRAETGKKKKYGVYLQTHNGRDALWDAYQEALDLVMYLRQRILEEEARDST